MTSELTTVSSLNSLDNFSEYLIKKLSNEDEKQFALHFKLYLDYGDNNKIFPIDFDDVWKLCEFTRKNDAKRILLKHFKENEDYIMIRKEEQSFNDENCYGIRRSDFLLPEPLEYNDENRSSFLKSDFLLPEPLENNEEDNRKNNGGHNKETIMLNVDTFKEFCMKASTSKAKEIRNYYLKLEKIFFLYTKEQLSYEKEKNKKLETVINNFDNKQNKIYKNVYNNQNVVYILKLQSFNDGKYIIKIGYTDNLKDRIYKLTSEYSTIENPIIIMDIFPCEDNKKFETFLHNHPDIVKYKYTNTINNKKSSIETYIIDDYKYEKIKRIIEFNIIYYNGKNIELIKENNKTLELHLKLKELELIEKYPEKFELLCELKKKEIDFNNKLYDNPEFFDKYIDLYKNQIINDNINNKEIIKEEEIKTEIIVKKTTDCGPFVQVYDGNDTTKLLHVFNSITDTIRNIKDTSFTGIKNAATYNRLYKGYRWYFVNRNDPNPNEIKDIGETIVPNQKNVEFIALLDIKMENIEKVFIKQKDISKFLNQNESAVCRAINFKLPLSNKYLIYWHLISNELQDNYLKSNTLPLLTDKQNGKKVQKIDPKTNEIIKTYLSIVDAIKDLKISPKTIKKINNDNSIYNDYKLKLI